MIIDSLSNADKYINLHPRFAKAFEFIKSQNLETIEVGKYPIDGAELHAAVSEKEGYSREEAKFECHNNWLDIQVCPTGKEQIGWSARERVSSPKGEYNAEKDVTFYNDKPDTYFTLLAGQLLSFILKMCMRLKLVKDQLKNWLLRLNFKKSPKKIKGEEVIF